MNYHEARKLKDKSGWHFTCMNDGHIWPEGYCRDHDPHPTRQEAQECFRRYLLDGQCEETYGDWTGCEVCDEPTKKGLTTRPPLGTGYPLCDAHRNAETLETLVGPVGHIAASY